MDATPLAPKLIRPLKMSPKELVTSDPTKTTRQIETSNSIVVKGSFFRSFTTILYLPQFPHNPRDIRLYALDLQSRSVYYSDESKLVLRRNLISCHISFSITIDGGLGAFRRIVFKIKIKFSSSIMALNVSVTRW